MICLDGGTESIRAGLYDQAGTQVATAACAYTTRFPQAGWAEQDPAEWWSALAIATRACLESAAVSPPEILGLCLDATTCTMVLLDRHLDVLRPALLWMDVRAAEQANRLFAAGSSAGHPALRYSLAGCNAEWMPPKMAWLAEHEPENYRQAAWICEYTDWLVYRLTGRLALNLNTITQRWYYNGREWGWPADLYARVGLGDVMDKIPQDILPAGQEVGTLLPEAARQLGLPETVRVFQGGGDAFIGMLGLNVAQPGRIGLITGSSNVIGGFVDQEFHGAGLYGAFPDAVVQGLWLVEGGQASTGSILAWFKRTFAQDLPSSQVYQLLDQEAALVPPGSGGVVALDYFQGNRTPYTDSKARGALWGLSLNTTRAQVFRALMEGVAFGNRLILDSLAKYGHMTPACTPQALIACGGATRSPLFMQIYADICGVPISVTRVDNAPLMGCAILAFQGLGLYPDLPQAAQAMVKTSRTFTPNPENQEAYDFYFQLYTQTYPALQPLMHGALRGHGH